MKNLKSLHNLVESIAVITSYPSQGQGRTLDKGVGKLNAIAWHSEKTLTALSRQKKIVALSEQGRTLALPVTTTQNKHLKIHRAWKKGSIFSILSLHRYMDSNISTVYVPFEFNVFGGIIPNLSLLALLMVLKLKGKRVVFELHQVILDIKKLQKHVPIHPKLYGFFNVSLRMFYMLVGLIADSVIVFEHELKIRLTGLISQKKISVLPLAVQPLAVQTPPQKKQLMSMNTAKKQTGVLVFGFINGYKGIEWIINKFKHSESKLNNSTLIIAGGKNPYLTGKAFYEKFYASVVSQIKKAKNVIHTGFIPDSNVKTYFAAADVVVLPYEVFMSASGPFSLALSYKKPVLLSDVLLPYAKTPDIQKALKLADLTTKDVFFKMNDDSLITMIARLQRSKAYRTKLTKFVEILAIERSEEKTTEKLLELLVKKNPQPFWKRILPYRIAFMSVHLKRIFFNRFSKRRGPEGYRSPALSFADRALSYTGPRQRQSYQAKIK